MILPGFDLFDPLPGTRILLPGLGLVPFVGVPLETFDFEMGSGPVPTGNTDTVVQRLDRIDAPAPGTEAQSRVLLRAMQLVSESRIDPGFGEDFYFLTLQAGMLSDGMMAFTEFGGSHGPPPPPHAFFRYVFINWHFDLRKGSLAGPAVASDTKVLSSAFIPWSHFPPLDAMLITDVNFRLGGMACELGTDCADVFPIGTFVLISPDGTVIPTQTATVPEPATAFLVGIGLAGIALRARRRSRATRGR
jgi:PEP-CTERM motif